MTPTDLDKLKALSAKWREKIYGLRRDFKPSWASDLMQGVLTECAADLDALIAELEKGQS